MSWRVERALRAEAEQVVAEAEAMIGGRMLDRHPREDSPPAWVLLDTLAHGEWRYLTNLSKALAKRRGHVWDSALLFLAGEVLATAGSPAGLRDLQRTHLVPLELHMLAGGCPVLTTPSGLVDAVSTELARARSRRRHPSAGPPPDPAAG
jgi:hypothetical protein